MTQGLLIDREAIARACRAHSVSRLRMFGSATTAAFDHERSDVDFLVEFAPGTDDPFDAYFGSKEDLELIVGRPVDLVMESAVRNPFFAASASSSARDLYAA